MIEEAAALWESISQNRAFIDGNKRTAFAVMYPFDELVPWLRNHVKREKPEN